VVGKADKVLSHEVGDAKAYCLPKMCISILKSADFAADKRLLLALLKIN